VHQIDRGVAPDVVAPPGLGGHLDIRFTRESRKPETIPGDMSVNLCKRNKSWEVIDERQILLKYALNGVHSTFLDAGHKSHNFHKIYATRRVNLFLGWKLTGSTDTIFEANFNHTTWKATLKANTYCLQCQEKPVAGGMT
jgi:hypothetical protein